VLGGLRRRLDLGKAAARLGSFASAHKGAIRAVLFAGAFVLVVLLVHREVYSFIMQRRTYAVPPIKTAVAPHWADRFGVEVVRVRGSETTLFDEGLVERVGRAFESCAWVRRVTAVERVFPDELRVRFEYRRPHVAVRRPNGYALVDAEGVRLPGVYADAPPCDRPAVVVGVASSPPEPGRAWQDPALGAAVRMADFAHGNPTLRRLGIREVDVANFGGRQDARRSEVTLLTASGCALQWGRTPEASRYGDLPAEEKLENLREVLAAYPELAGLRCVKLYFKGSRAVEPVDGATIWRKR